VLGYVLPKFKFLLNTKNVKKTSGFLTVVLFVLSLFVGTVAISVSTDVVMAPVASASVYCTSNSFGSTSCSGPNGSTYCNSNSFGSTSCSGPGGSTYCNSNSFGSTSCSGPGGSSYCNSNSFGSSSCSGNAFIPLPTPTPYSYYTAPTPTPYSYYTAPTPTPYSYYTAPTPKPFSYYSAPTPNSLNNVTTSKQTCTSSAGLPTNCVAFPAFGISYCSTLGSGTLQQQINGAWSTLWAVSGVRDSSECTDPGWPYHFRVAGDLAKASNVALRVVYKAESGKPSRTDSFKVVIKK